MRNVMLLGDSRLSLKEETSCQSGDNDQKKQDTPLPTAGFACRFGCYSFPRMFRLRHGLSRPCLVPNFWTPTIIDIPGQGDALQIRLPIQAPAKPRSKPPEGRIRRSLSKSFVAVSKLA